ncbi:MAG: hypothetical protein JWN76_1851 [Chitinophagaceae bacterium]|nr:hypothetical protein [Chitinophagaceae bacterium]
MIAKGLERLSGETIDERATKLLMHFKENYFQFIRPTYVRDIATFLHEKHKIEFDFTATLGFGADGGKIIGAFNPVKKIILIDASLSSDESKFNFTLAHEFGHLSLHRNIKLIYEPEDDKNGSDTLALKEKCRTDGDWMEWQANRYAAALLLPKTMLEQKLARIQVDMGISRLGHIIINQHPSSYSDYSQIVASLSDYFKVSITAVQIRLKNLGFVTDHRVRKMAATDWLEALKPQQPEEDIPF